MKTYDVTIIIPCYNCSSTLEQAFDSCFKQDVAGTFEVVMVNDASTDTTWEVMQRLAAGKQNVVISSHEKNRDYLLFGQR